MSASVSGTYWLATTITMLPPLVRRCPDCGHLTLSVRFTRVEGGDRVECPVCGYRFEPVENPWLA